jgi:steroid delta-isomerase-like uncharacterized protein
MSPKSPTAIADLVIVAFNAGDWPQLSAIFDAEIRYVETGTGREVAGAGPYIELLQGWRQVFPDCTGTISATVAEGGLVAHDIVWEGTQEGPLPTPMGLIPASGRRIKVRASIWYSVAGGKVSAITHHLDVLTMLQQLGAFETARAA